MATYVDTSAFYAMMDLDDEFHKESKITFSKLIGEREIFHSSNYVIFETIALLQSRLGLEAIRVFQDDLMPIVNIHWIDKTVHTVGINSMLIAHQKEISLVDYTSFEIMRTLGIKKVFAFDKHFRENGFQVLGLC